MHDRWQERITVVRSLPSDIFIQHFDDDYYMKSIRDLGTTLVKVEGLFSGGYF